jgi:hypothetical protein
MTCAAFRPIALLESVYGTTLFFDASGGWYAKYVDLETR